MIGKGDGERREKWEREGDGAGRGNRRGPLLAGHISDGVYRRNLDRLVCDRKDKGKKTVDDVLGPALASEGAEGIDDAKLHLHTLIFIEKLQLHPRAQFQIAHRRNHAWKFTHRCILY